MIARRALGHTVSHFGDFAPTWAVALFAFAAFVLFKISDAQSAGTVEILGKWTPLFLKGFCNDILITLISMMIGTFLALLLAITRMAGNQFVRGTITAVTGILRNVPGIVFLFFVAFALPYKFGVGAWELAFPAYAKVVFSFSLKIMANMAEVIRGGLQSIPIAQWEAGETIGLSRWQVFFRVALAQCIRRIAPATLNVFGIFFCAVPIASLIGVESALTLAGYAIKAERQTHLILPIYAYVGSWYFGIGYLVFRLFKKYESAQAWT
jgi:polar amino acid transport system permease protein